jgi:hypothetical protein
MNELERLGRPRAYRLGALRTRGAGPVPPEPSRPTFARPGLAGLVAGWRGWRLRATLSAGDGRVPAGDVGLSGRGAPGGGPIMEHG